MNSTPLIAVADWFELLCRRAERRLQSRGAGGRTSSTRQYRFKPYRALRSRFEGDDINGGVGRDSPPRRMELNMRASPENTES